MKGYKKYICDSCISSDDKHPCICEMPAADVPRYCLCDCLDPDDVEWKELEAEDE